MLCRQKLLLALLECAGAPITRIKLVKLVFLLTQEHQLPPDISFYSFVPFKYGPYSFALAHELGRLEELAILTGDERDVRIRDGMMAAVRSIVCQLPIDIRRAASKVWKLYGPLQQTTLLRSVYRRFPEFTFNSKLRNLVPKGAQAPQPAPIAIYTIGYEGRSVDSFLNSAISSGIQAIVDVRWNPISRKYGFARATLSALCSMLSLEYVHIPELGISSEWRKKSDSRETLLDGYQRRLPSCRSAQQRALGILQSKPAALLCMEADPALCHRSRLAASLAGIGGLRVLHL